MAWYEAPRFRGAMVGDEAFDAMHALLEGLSRCYQVGVGRRSIVRDGRSTRADGE